MAFLRMYAASLLGRVFQQLTIPTRYGFTLKGNTRELIGRMIYAHGVWEPDLTGLILERVGKQTQFIDVGANLGYFSALAATQGARVEAIEASPDMSRTTSRNLQRFGDQARVINAAVAASEGELTLYESHLSLNWGARTTVPNGQAIHAVVPAAPLGKLVDLEGDTDLFIKIDIEGAERPVLEELLQLLGSKPTRKIAIVAEIAPDNRDLIPQFIASGCAISRLHNDYSRDAYANYSGHGYELTPHDSDVDVPSTFDFFIEYGVEEAAVAS